MLGLLAREEGRVDLLHGAAVAPLLELLVRVLDGADALGAVELLEGVVVPGAGRSRTTLGGIVLHLIPPGRKALRRAGWVLRGPWVPSSRRTIPRISSRWAARCAGETGSSTRSGSSAGMAATKKTVAPAIVLARWTGSIGERRAMALAVALEDLLADEIEERPGVLEHGRPVPGRGVGDLAQDQARDRGPRADVVDPGSHAGFDPGGQGIGARERRRDLFEQPPEDARENGVIELLLVLEVVDDRGAADPDPIGDVLEAGGGEALLGEDRLGGLEHGGPGALRARALRRCLRHGR